MLADSLPSLYQLLLPKEFLELRPQEKLATCERCYKTQSQAPKPHFHSKIKCCTYYPFLPNYLVGGVLTETPSSQGAQVIRQFIRDRQFALPLGICAPPGYQALFRTKKQEDFGNDFNLACPFYEAQTQGCSVWRYRGHECATYFCVSSYKKGSEFWTSVSEYLHHAEMIVSQACMIEKGYLLPEIEAGLPYVLRDGDDKNRAWRMEALEWSKIWAHHMEDIENYYRATFEFVLRQHHELKRQIDEGRPNSHTSDPGFLKTLLMGGEVPEAHRHGAGA